MKWIAQLSPYYLCKISICTITFSNILNRLKNINLQIDKFGKLNNDKEFLGFFVTLVIKDQIFFISVI